MASVSTRVTSARRLQTDGRVEQSTDTEYGPFSVPRPIAWNGGPGLSPRCSRIPQCGNPGACMLRVCTTGPRGHVARPSGAQPIVGGKPRAAAVPHRARAASASTVVDARRHGSDRVVGAPAAVLSASAPRPNARYARVSPSRASAASGRAVDPRRPDTAGLRPGDRGPPARARAASRRRVPGLRRRRSARRCGSARTGRRPSAAPDRDGDGRRRDPAAARTARSKWRWPAQPPAIAERAAVLVLAPARSRERRSV